MDQTRAVMEEATRQILAQIRETGRPDHPGEPLPWDINRGRCVDWAELVCGQMRVAAMDEGERASAADIAWILACRALGRRGIAC
jgi:hypothetical protein